MINAVSKNPIQTRKNGRGIVKQRLCQHLSCPSSYWSCLYSNVYPHRSRSWSWGRKAAVRVGVLRCAGCWPQNVHSSLHWSDVGTILNRYSTIAIIAVITVINSSSTGSTPVSSGVVSSGRLREGSLMFPYLHPKTPAYEYTTPATPATPATPGSKHREREVVKEIVCININSFKWLVKGKISKCISIYCSISEPTIRIPVFDVLIVPAGWRYRRNYDGVRWCIIPIGTKRSAQWLLHLVNAELVHDLSTSTIFSSEWRQLQLLFLSSGWLLCGSDSELQILVWSQK